jgi:hypothetical protein
MFCPKCGQEQLAEVPNFCSRCGFPLTEVTSLLARGGAPGEVPENKPPRRKARRSGLWLVLASIVFFFVAVLSAEAEGDVSVALFGFLTVASFFIGMCTLIYSWIKGRSGRRSEPGPLGQQTRRVEAPQWGALPPAYAPPVTMPKTRFDTGEVAEPPSVTENTTRHLEQEAPRERERTR